MKTFLSKVESICQVFWNFDIIKTEYHGFILFIPKNKTSILYVVLGHIYRKNNTVCVKLTKG